MAKAAFDAIKEGLEEAIAYNEGRTEDVLVSRYPVEQIDVAKIRRSTGLSQAEFCARFGFSKPTLTKWEQGQRRPTGPARVLLKVIERAPCAVLDALAA